MRVYRLLALALPLLVTACNTGPSPRQLTPPSITPGVWGVVDAPASPGPHPGIILIPGSGGWRPGYLRFARAFADSGFVVLTLDYYAVTGRGSTRAEEIQHWPAWQATIHNALIYLAEAPGVAGQPIALVGYSRGAMLAISVGTSAPAPAAIVDFFGAGSDNDPPDSLAARFPPLLILHGTADSNIPVAQAQRLYDRIRIVGGDVEMHLYPNAEHGFNTPWAPGYSASDAVDSWGRAVDFLKRHLANKRN